jgi:Zn-dependent alcohol dehydrogenase
VERVGDGVTAVRPGDTVLLMWRPRCGVCRHCTTGRPALCPLGAVHAATGGLVGGGTRLSHDGEPVHHLMGVSCFADRAVVSERSVIPIPADVPPEIAAILGCAVITGVGAVLNQMPGAAGSAAVVIGAGGVGLSAVMGLRLVGAHPILVLDPVPERLELARELGATVGIDANAPDVLEQVAAAAPDGVAYSLDAVGQPATLSRAFEVLAQRGTLVAVGLARAGATVSIPVNPLVQQERRIVGSLYGSANPSTQIPQLIELYRAGKLPLDRLVGPRFALDSVNEAIAALRSGGVGRAILVP